MNKKKFIERLEKVARKEISRGNFNGSIKIDEIKQEPPFEACVNLKTHMIQEGVNLEFEKENPQKTEPVIRDITRHEIAHIGYSDLGGCPKTADNHVKLILEPILPILQTEGFGIGDAEYATNALEDTLLHVALRKEFALDGVITFFEEVGKMKKTFTPFYDAHVQLNMWLWGNKSQRNQLTKYRVKNKEKQKLVSEVIQNFLKKSGLSEIKQEIEETQIKDRQRITYFLDNEENWSKIAIAYAEEFSKLMEPGYAQPIQGHSGKGTKGQPRPGEPKGKPSNTPKAKEQENTGSKNPFDKERKSKNYKQKRIKEAQANGETVPEWIDHFEAMDLIYQSLAQKLHIKAETFTEQSSFPIYHYGTRPFDPEKDDLKRVTFGLNEKGELELKKKRWHEDMPLEYKVKPKGFPQARLCLLDTSSSMQESFIPGESIGQTNIIPWGDNSKYHYSILAWYGLLEYLKQNHLLQQTGISLGNFSSSTVVKNGLEEAKRLALKPQWGGTELDLDVVKNMFNGRDLLLFTISDGDIYNWSQIKDSFITYAKKHHYFHLQMGSVTTASKDLKKAGLIVVPINNGMDLANKVIDLTDQMYRRVQ